MLKKPLRPPGSRELLVLLSLMTSLAAMSIDALLPALRDIQHSLLVPDIRDTQLIVSVFIMGMVFGELLFGPISDAVGRINAILSGLVIFIIGALIAMNANSLETMLLGRLVQGFGVSGPKIATRALVRDQFAGDEMARIMSYIFTIFIIVPLIAPSLGQLVLQIAQWRGIFGFLIAVACIAGLWLRIRQPETLPVKKRIRFNPGNIIRNLRQIASNKRVLAYTFAAGFGFGAKLLYLSIAQAVFNDVYNIQQQFPLYFAFLASGIGISSFINARLVRRFGSERLSIMALTGMIFFSLILLAGSWQSDGHPSLAFFVINCFLIFCTLGMLFGNVNALAMESLGEIAGIGASFIASVSSMVAIVIATMLGRFYDGSTLVLGMGFLIGSLLALFSVLLAKRCQSQPPVCQ